MVVTGEFERVERKVGDHEGVIIEGSKRRSRGSSGRRDRVDSSR